MGLEEAKTGVHINRVQSITVPAAMGTLNDEPQLPCLRTTGSGWAGSV